MNRFTDLPYSLTTAIKDNNIKIIERDMTYNWAVYYEVIAINKKLNFYKTRWTLAHELWHFFDTQEKNPIAPYLSRYKQEKFADNFAMSQLLPAKELEEKVKIYGWSLSELEVYFWVEKEIIEKRIKQLKF